MLAFEGGKAVGVYWTPHSPNTSTCARVQDVEENVPMPLVVHVIVPVGTVPDTYAEQYTAVPTGTGVGAALEAEQVTEVLVLVKARAEGPAHITLMARATAKPMATRPPSRPLKRSR